MSFLSAHTHTKRLTNENWHKAAKITTQHVHSDDMLNHAEVKMFWLRTDIIIINNIIIKNDKFKGR